MSHPKKSSRPKTPSQTNKNKKDELELIISQLLNCLGEDLKRPGLIDTPKRVAEALCELTQGSGIAIKDIAQKSLLKAPSQELIILKDTKFHSLCEHHFLPFFGSVDIAYIPHQNIIGLGTIGQIIDACSQKLHLQENLTDEIADVLQTTLKPKGLMIVIKAQHFCIEMRGLRKQGSFTITRATRGVLASDQKIRQEVAHLLQD